MQTIHAIPDGNSDPEEIKRYFYRIVDENGVTLLMPETDTRLPEEETAKKQDYPYRTIFAFCPDNGNYKKKSMQYRIAGSHSDMFMLQTHGNIFVDLPQSEDNRKKDGIFWDGSLQPIHRKPLTEDDWLYVAQDMIGAFGIEAINMLFQKEYRTLSNLPQILSTAVTLQNSYLAKNQLH